MPCGSQANESEGCCSLDTHKSIWTCVSVSEAATSFCSSLLARGHQYTRSMHFYIHVPHTLTIHSWMDSQGGWTKVKQTDIVGRTVAKAASWMLSVVCIAQSPQAALSLLDLNSSRPALTAFLFSVACLPQQDQTRKDCLSNLQVKSEWNITFTVPETNLVLTP